jgi:hypothetical protein
LFWQITKTALWRRMILHFSHIGLTDGLTFMIPFGWSLRHGSGCRDGRRYRVVVLPSRAKLPRIRAGQRMLAIS